MPGPGPGPVLPVVAMLQPCSAANLRLHNSPRNLRCGRLEVWAPASIFEAFNPTPEYSHPGIPLHIHPTILLM